MEEMIKRSTGIQNTQITKNQTIKT